MSKTLYEHEADLHREAYAQQVSRREAIRGTLSVPLAVLGFSAFGMNGLAANAVLGLASPLQITLLAAAVLFLLAALGAFGRALYLAVWRFDYSMVQPLPAVEDLSQQATLLSEQLRREEVALDAIRALSEQGAWQALGAEYAEKARDLNSRNDDNLDVQKALLRAILLGIGALLLSILLFAGLRLAMEAQGTALPDTLNFAPRCLIFCTEIAG